MDPQLLNLQRKVDQYKEVLKNTQSYRIVWKEQLKDKIAAQLTELARQIQLDGKVTVRADLENLEAIVFTLGESKSGIYQRVNDHLQQDLIKHNGSLIYQQLFNGKVIVLIQYPFIENYGQPRPPKTVAIYRPEEITPPFMVRHLEEFLLEITQWEDYDDDEPNKRIGFQLNFGGDQQQPK